MSVEQMSNLEQMTAEQLALELRDSNKMIDSLIQSLESRPDMQQVIRKLMTPDDMLETFSQIGVDDPDLARLTLQVAVAAFVNIQAARALEAEILRRSAEMN